MTGYGVCKGIGVGKEHAVFGRCKHLSVPESRKGVWEVGVENEAEGRLGWSLCHAKEFGLYLIGKPLGFLSRARA
jgi:hypothetical protein